MHGLFPTAKARDAVVREYGAIEGGKRALERLAEPLPNMGARDGSLTGGNDPRQR
jgi:hypothetical protein